MGKHKHIVLVVLVILLATALISSVPTVFAQDVEDSRRIYRSQYLILNTQINTKVDVVSTGPRPNVEQVGAKITFFPKQTALQQILEKDYNPEPQRESFDGALEFNWNNPGPGQKLPLQMNTKLKILNNPKRIRDKVPFPLRGIPPDAQQYTLPAKIMDSNPAIIRLASELAQGEDDMVVVVDKIAAWVTQNVKYNLSTVTADASQPASWVLQNRYGVCDELTSLFGSLLRALGIPVKFVAGVSYTNSPLFKNKWGPHGWSEVYFPGYGWIPYDVTYGEYGYVDPGHILSKASADAEKITSRFTWRGRDVDINIGQFDTTVHVEQYGPEVEDQIALEMDIEKGAVGFGSYNLIVATIRNLRDYYQSLDMHLSKTTKLETLSPRKQHILLKPGDEKTIHWLVKVNDDLKRNFIYTFPVSVYTTGNFSQQKSFKAIDGGVMLSEKRIKNMISKIDKGEVKETVTDLGITCTSKDASIYLDEQTTLTCTLQNNGNALIQDLNVCLDESCQEVEIGITQQQQVAFMYKGADRDPGLQDVIITAKNDQFDQMASVEVGVLDKPVIEIANLTFPKEVGYQDLFTVSFALAKPSTSHPKHVKLLVEANSVQKEFTIDELRADQPFTVQFRGDQLGSGSNTIKVKAMYQGEKSDHFKVEQTETVTLANLTAWQKVKSFFGTIGNVIVSWI